MGIAIKGRILTEFEGAVFENIKQAHPSLRFTDFWYTSQEFKHVKIATGGLPYYSSIAAEAQCELQVKM